MKISGARERRAFLRFLMGSPLFAQAFLEGAEESPAKLANPKEALDVLEFEQSARQVLPPAHWGYLASGVDDDLTVKANREGFKHLDLRPRRLVDTSHTDRAIELFGTRWESPIFLCPVGAQMAFNPEGELAVARAAKAKNALQILSTMTSVSVEDVAKARGAAPWYQLYIPAKWDNTEKMIRRVEAAGCPVLVWTVDLLGGRNMETLERFRRMDTRNCADCHSTAPFAANPARPMFNGIDPSVNPGFATWGYVNRLKKLTAMKLVIKGIDNADDARLAREHGADGILVSNHGGRSTETGRATIDCLAEVVDAVGAQIPVMVDGGFRRGSDVFKALALGARAVGVGRPYIWGLSVFGQSGVERVIEILNAELVRTMQQCGTPAIAKITRASVIQRRDS